MLGIIGLGVFSDYVGDVSARRGEIDRSVKASCKNDDECSRKDLSAQVRMADATEVLVDISLYQFILGVAGSMLIGATLVYSVRATQAATRAVEIAEDTAQRQLRCYLMVSSKILGAVAAGDSPRAGVSFKNIGQTPIHNFSPQMRLVVAPWPVPPDLHVWHEIKEVRSREGTVIGYLGETASASVNLSENNEQNTIITEENIQDILTRKSCLFLSGVVYYDDIFSHSHETAFGYAYVGANFRSDEPDIVSGYTHGS